VTTHILSSAYDATGDTAIASRSFKICQA